MNTRPLDQAELEGMAAERQWINDLLAGFGSDVRLTGSATDIPTLHTLLDRGPFTEDVIAELELFGGAFGDILANEIGLSWVVFEDEAGTDFALKFGSHKVVVFPRDMLAKRVEAGESPSQINLLVMLNEISHAVREQASRASI